MRIGKCYVPSYRQLFTIATTYAFHFPTHFIAARERVNFKCYTIHQRLPNTSSLMKIISNARQPHNVH